MKTESEQPAYRWALRYLWKFKRTFVAVVSVSLILSAMELIIPKLLQVFTDEFSQGSMTLQLLLGLTGVLAISLVVKTYLKGRSNLWNASLSEYAMKQLHEDMFAQLRRLGLGYIDRTPTGEILSLYHNEVKGAQSLFTRYFPKTLEHSIFLVIGFGYLLTVHPILTLAILPFFFSYYFIGPYFERKAAWYSKEQAERAALMNKQIYDSAASLLEVRHLQADEWDHRKLDERQSEWREVVYKQHFNAYMRGTVRRLSVAFGSVFIFFLGAWYVRNDQLTVGEFIAFTYLYFTVIARLTYLVTNLTEQKVISQQIVRLYRFMHQLPTVPEPEQPLRVERVIGGYRIERVRFEYEHQQDRSVLSDLSFEIQPGEHVAIVGPSGSGKSTLLKLLGRLYDPSQGSILLDGIDLRSLGSDQLRSIVGYVFQETYLFPNTVRENICFGRLEATEDEIREAARAAYALEFIEALPQGMDTLIGERGIKLSGGQKQRLAIARLFLMNPPVLLLDEATSALDNASEREVQHALEHLMRGRTTVTVAHRLSTVRHADRILVLKAGHIVEAGDYSALIALQGVFASLVQQGSLSEVLIQNAEDKEAVS